MNVTPQERLARRVLLIGWDAADWQMIRPLMDKGLMPTLKGMIEGGAWGALGTMRPILSPMLWNSIATGKRPDKHGVHGFAEVTPDGKGVRPVTSTSRRCKALWNILTQQGMDSNVVGWYASHPAEPIRGVMVSNQFEIAHTKPGDPWPVLHGSVHPEELAGELASLRVHPTELDAGAILPFAPNLRDPHPDKDPLLAKLMQLLAQTVSIHTIATRLMERPEWDFTAIYYEGIDRFGHEFMHLHPPKQEGIDEAEFEIYSEVMNGVYRFHDMMLETLLNLAGDDTAVILVSDHGYYSREDRPKIGGQAGPTDWHRDYGVVALNGPPFKEGNQLFGAGLLDVAPTVLRLFGLPVGDDMDGRPWVESLREPLERFKIPTWEEVAGESGRLAPEDPQAVDPVENLAALNRLAALGYIDPVGDDIEEAIRRTVADQKMNLAVSLIDSGRTRMAIPELQRVLELNPGHTGVTIQLAVCLAQKGDLAEARELIGPVLEKEERPRARLLLGALDAAAGAFSDALKHFRAVEEANPRLPGLHLRLGRACAELQLWEEADRAFESAMKIDPDSAGASAGLCETKLALGRIGEAIDHGLTAVESAFFFPRAHYVLGRALSADNQFDRAKQALQVAVRQAPRSIDIRLALAETFRDAGEPQSAAEELRECLILDPGAEAARAVLAELYEGPLGDPTLAEQTRREGELRRIADKLRPMASDDR